MALVGGMVLVPSANKDLYSCELRRQKIYELYEIYRECRFVQSDVDVIVRQLTIHGIGLFVDRARIEELPLVMRRWLNGGWLTRFIREATAQLACFGLCVYELYPDEFRAGVVDLRTVQIIMSKQPNKAAEYEIRRVLGPLMVAQGSYMLQVIQEPDMLTGETTGILGRIVDQFCDMKMYARNAVVRDTTNSQAFYLLENRNGETAVRDYMSTGQRSGDQVHRAEGLDPTAVDIPGYSVSVQTVLDTRAELKEEMWLTSERFMRNMTTSEKRLKGLRTRYPVGDDVNPAESYFQHVEPGMTSEQRKPLPGVDVLVEMLIYNERQIHMAFGVPFSLVEEHTGAHTNTMDSDSDQLQQTTRQYIGPLQEMLENISVHLFGSMTTGELCESLKKLARCDVARGSASEAKLEAKLPEGQPLTLRLMTVVPARHMQVLFENGLLRQDAYVRYLSETIRIPTDEFETRDVRPIMQEEEMVGGGKAPGHHGKMTLSKKGHGQQQSSDAFATLKRKHKTPGT